MLAMLRAMKWPNMTPKHSFKRNRRVSFNDRFADLKAHKEINGHLRVTEKDDKSENNWFTNIISAQKGTCNMKLTADRIAALVAIGFDWESANKNEASKIMSTT